MEGMTMPEILYQVEHLKKYYITEKDIFGRPIKMVKGVDDVSFSVHQGEILGVVGESGCGKSTLGRTMLKLQEPTEGRLIFNGTDITGLSAKEMRQYRKQMQIVFQDPFAAINPRKTILEYVKEPLDVFKIGDPKERKDRTIEMLRHVGLPDAHIYRYPHELSGGQRQRVVIARAVISSPEFIVCDEPVSALDVSIRAQILNLMKQLQKEMGITYLFISHDLSVVRYLCNRVVVMYLGKVVEIADKKELFSHPLHPYTQVLLSAIPVPEFGAKKDRLFFQGELPSPLNPPSGCRLHSRCPYATEQCSVCEQELRDAGNGHLVACCRYQEIQAEAASAK
jgi:peptide/nickel transport system ATP-binding protein/oligopeptide transport system ATP-binding protein